MGPMTWTAIASIASAIIGGIATAVGTNKTNDVSREISNQNISFQQQENEITRLREDNAQVRAAEDLQAAGLSKTLAAGNPASAAALSAPQADYQYQDPTMKAMQQMNLAQMFMDLKSLATDVKKKEAETDSINLSNSVFMDHYFQNKSLNEVNVELAKSQIASYDAQTKLTQMLGSYQVEKIKAEIDSILSSTDLTMANIGKVKQEIDNLISQKYKLDKEAKLLSWDIISAEVDVKIKRHNLDYAERFDLPVGSMLNGTPGAWANAINSIISNFRNSGGSYTVPWNNPGQFTFGFGDMSQYQNGDYPAYI